MGCAPFIAFFAVSGPTASNQLSGVGLVYDADGDVITDNNNVSYTYDAEGRIATAGGWTYGYDGDGNRVLTSGGSTRGWPTSPAIGDMG